MKLNVGKVSLVQNDFNHFHFDGFQLPLQETL